MEGTFFPYAEAEREILDPGKVERRVLSRGGKIMMVEVSFAQGGVGAIHDHPHEQATYCLGGEFLFTAGASSRVLSAGDSVFVPASVPHGVECRKEGRLLDVFTPQREDFLKKA